MKVHNIIPIKPFYIDKNILDDADDNGFTDLIPVSLIKHYINHIQPTNNLPPLIMSIGETWAPIHPFLQNALTNVPDYIHSYQLSNTGLPKLKKVLKNFLVHSYKLEERHSLADYEVAITTTGTKSFMHYFARYLIEKKGKSTAIITCPSWYYEEAISYAGFNVEYVMVDAVNDFIPSIEQYRTIIKQCKNAQKVGLMIINTQNNPTGKNWPESLILQLIDLAIEEEIAILLDDAHFAQVDYGTAPTISIKLLLDRLLTSPDSNLDWMCVRSLGKQFGCNGWGIGAIVSSKSCLENIINNNMNSVTHNCYHAAEQYTLAMWLENGPWKEYTESMQIKLKEKRELVRSYLIENLKYPEELIPKGECTPFTLFPMPLKYNNNSVTEAIKDIFLKTGVLLAPGYLNGTNIEFTTGFRYLRLYIGVDQKVLLEVLKRFSEHNLSY